MGTRVQVMRTFARQRPHSLKCALPSSLAGHAMNPSLQARWRHPCRRTVRTRRGHTADGFTWRLGMSQTQRSRHHGNTLDGCELSVANVGLSPSGERRARRRRGIHATPGSCRRRGEGSVGGLRCQPACRSFRGLAAYRRGTSGRRATGALRDEASPKPRSRKAAAICFDESQIPYPESRQLKHPAPTPSAPVQAILGAPAA